MFYNVGYNMPGFLPDDPTQIAEFANLDEARQYLLSELESELERAEEHEDEFPEEGVRSVERIKAAIKAFNDEEPGETTVLIPDYRGVEWAYWIQRFTPEELQVRAVVKVDGDFEQADSDEVADAFGVYWMDSEGLFQWIQDFESREVAEAYVSSLKEGS